MSSTVIRDFLVALTFKTDDSGAKKSKDALDSNEKSAKLLSRALIALASTAVIAVAKTANELEKLYYSSQRIGASANNIRAYGDAISQMGGSAEGALSSLESVARKLRESPGYEGMLKGLGVNTRDQNGQMRDRVEVMKDLSKTLQGMEYYKANAYAGALGIDETTLMAMRDGKFTSEMDKYQKLRKSMGLNDDLAKSGQEFAYQWRDMMMQLKALMEVILMTAGKALIPVLKLLNQLIQFIIHWFGQLDPQLKSFLATGLKIALLTVVFGGLFSAVAKFAKLLPMLTGLLNIFKALRLVFLASPIGIVLALAAAIALLWDDYQTWKNGGESLIDWSKWSKGLDKAIESIKTLSEKLKNLAKAWMEFAKGAYDKAVDWTSRNIIEPIANAINNPEQAKQGVTEAVQQAGAAAVKAVVDTVNSVKDDVQEKAQANVGGPSLKLSEQDIVDIMKVASTEVVPGLKGKDFENQAAGVVDTILNRVASGKYGKGVRGVANQRWAFSDINAPRKSAYGSVQNVPMSRVSDRMESFVREYLKKRASGQASSVGENLNYANPYYLGEAKPETIAWVKEAEAQAKKTGQIFGSGKAIHVHGTPSADKQKMPKPFRVVLEDDQNNGVQSLSTPTDRDALARMAQNANIPNDPKYVAPNLSNTQSSVNKNVNINQKTDIHVTGGDAPMTAKAVRKEQDAVNLQMSRNAAGLFG